MNKGWRGESHRHYLAAKGIKTKQSERYFATIEDFAWGKKPSESKIKTFRENFDEMHQERIKSFDRQEYPDVTDVDALEQDRLARNLNAISKFPSIDRLKMKYNDVILNRIDNQILKVDSEIERLSADSQRPQLGVWQTESQSNMVKEQINDKLAHAMHIRQKLEDNRKEIASKSAQLHSATGSAISAPKNIVDEEVAKVGAVQAKEYSRFKPSALKVEEALNELRAEQQN